MLLVKGILFITENEVQKLAVNLVKNKSGSYRNQKLGRLSSQFTTLTAFSEKYVAARYKKKKKKKIQYKK